MSQTLGRGHLRSLIIVALLFGVCRSGLGQPEPQVAPGAAGGITLFQNVRIFDGKGGALSEPSNVLVRGTQIERISLKPIEMAPGAGAVVIDGGGRTLMPGLIDMHWHTTLARPAVKDLLVDSYGYLTLLASVEATDTLMRGFTTVRDLGGPAFDLKRAIDEGLIVGPRIYPSGAIITITSGHGDFRNANELPRGFGQAKSRQEVMGASMVADSPDEVRLRTREQLFQGATQIKLTAGGGVASPFSPLDASTFTEAELRAAVEAAENWGTYVTVHAYTTEAMKRSIAAGVKCIEHGHFLDESTAKIMAEKGIWLSHQVFPDEMANAFPRGSSNWIKAKSVFEGSDLTLRLVIKHKIKTVFGTDLLFSAPLAKQQGAMLALWARWFSSGETLAMATSNAAELLTLSGKRNPYPGKLGVVQEGALADLLLVDGNPIGNIKLLADPEKNLVVIMKDGKIYKNTLRK